MNEKNNKIFLHIFIFFLACLHRLIDRFPCDSTTMTMMMIIINDICRCPIILQFFARKRFAMYPKWNPFFLEKQKQIFLPYFFNSSYDNDDLVSFFLLIWLIRNNQTINQYLLSLMMMIRLGATVFFSVFSSSQKQKGKNKL